MTRRNVKEETQKNNLTDETYRIYLDNKFIGLGIVSENKLKKRFDYTRLNSMRKYKKTKFKQKMTNLKNKEKDYCTGVERWYYSYWINNTLFERIKRTCQGIIGGCKWKW